MLFNVEPDELKGLDGLQLVELLRVLLHAEARKSDVPMRNVDVPLQITVADGGQDAKVEWVKGKSSTDYFPARYIVFQCKAADGGDAAWKKEVWTKASQKKAPKVLNPATATALSRGGAYIGVTATALVGVKPEDRADAIKEGIRLAGHDPDKLSSVLVYDGNKLAAWASTHPAVALWIKERKSGSSLAGFNTLDQWGKRVEIATPDYVSSEDRTFALSAAIDDKLTFDQLAVRIVDHISEASAVVRIWGPSGIGKSRALHQALSTSELRNLVAANFIFCDFSEVSADIWSVANQIKNAGLAAVLVVDSCPWVEAKRLYDLARADGSELRVITLGADGQDQAESCLMIRPLKADQTTICGILNQAIKAPADEIDFVATQCDGFPRIAVLATKAFGNRASIGKSANDVAEEILEAAGVGRDTVRALELLSLFDHLEPDNDPEGFDTLSETLVQMKGECVFENLVIASERHLVERAHERMSAQPLPIANYLALRRLSYLRPSTVSHYLETTTPHRRDAMLARWGEFRERSDTLVQIVQNTVNRGALRDNDVLLGPDGAPYLAAFVHADPETMIVALHFAVNNMPLDELAKLDVSEGLLAALRLLALRKSSFRPTAILTLRLVAVSNFEDNTPVVQLLRQLFQVALAGTEADDRARRETLLKVLEDAEPRIRRAIVEALGAMLTTQMTRFGDIDQIGGEEFRSEWAPKTHEAVVDYFRWALERLRELWREDEDLRLRIEAIIARDLRTFLDFNLLDIVEAFVRDVIAKRGHWSDATKGIGDWLYFDRPAEENDTARAIRSLYDATMPTNPVDLALLYSRFWGADLHDPDTRYADCTDDIDFDYSANRTQELAPGIAKNPDQLRRVIDAMASEELNTPRPFAQMLAEYLTDPIDAFSQAVRALDASGNRAGINFVRSLLYSLDRRLAGDPEANMKLVKIAKESIILSQHPMDIYSSLHMTSERVEYIAEQVRGETLGPFDVVPISYGKGIADVPIQVLAILIDALVQRGKDSGAWAAVEILAMVTHGQEKLEPDVAALCTRAVLSLSIADGMKGNLDHAEYGYDRLIKLLAASGAMDGAFGTGFAKLIERACQSVGGFTNRPIDALRSGLAIVVEHAAPEAWAVLAGFYEVATRTERERLNMVIAPVKPFSFNNTDRIVAGALFNTPCGVALEWVDQDADNRIALLVSFYPMVERDGDNWKWHPATEDLADLYGSLGQFRRALRARILPSSYGGSLDDHLRRFLGPLAAWTDHSKLSDWATTILSDLELYLADET